MNETLYRPIGPRGQIGPNFSFLTMANLWCMGRANPKDWNVSLVSVSKPAIVGQDGMTLSPAVPSEGATALASYYDRSTQTGD